MPRSWTIRKEGKTYGSFTDQQIKSFASQGKLKEHDQLSPDSGKSWIVASTVKGLFTKATATTPPQASATASLVRGVVPSVQGSESGDKAAGQSTAGSSEESSKPATQGWGKTLATLFCAIGIISGITNTLFKKAPSPPPPAANQVEQVAPAPSPTAASTSIPSTTVVQSIETSGVDAAALAAVQKGPVTFSVFLKVIKIGMSADQVISLFGRPDNVERSRAAHKPGSTWLYLRRIVHEVTGKPEYFKIYFDSNNLVNTFIWDGKYWDQKDNGVQAVEGYAAYAAGERKKTMEFFDGFGEAIAPDGKQQSETPRHGNTAWHKYTSDDGIFEVSFPSEPQSRIIQADGDQVTHFVVEYNFPNNDPSLQLQVMLLTEEQNAAEWLPGLSKGMAQSLRGTILRATFIQVGSLPAHEALIQGTRNKKPIFVRTRDILVGKKVYSLIVSGKSLNSVVSDTSSQFMKAANILR